MLNWRLELSQSDFNRVSDLCTLLFVGLAVYFFGANRSVQSILVLLQWLPVILLPLLIAQVYSTRDQYEISALFLMFRRRGDGQTQESIISINLCYPYFGLCILSASAANVRTYGFYAGLMILCSWALWTVRSKRFSPLLWVALLALAGALGLAGQKGLHHLQGIVEQKTLGWFDELGRGHGDTYQARTAMGDIGTLKLSDRILFRVETGAGANTTLLLREASFNAYRSSIWFALHSRFKELRARSDGKTWELGSPSHMDKTVAVYAPLRNGSGLLKLPSGSHEITRLQVMKMARNRFGAVKVEQGPGLVEYRVRYHPGDSVDGPPDKIDLTLPEQEKSVIMKTARELGLPLKSPPDILKTLSAFFQNQFRYSLAQQRSESPETSIGRFLTESRAGHCEFFATATVLLLRAAGIPARYATGYSVEEFSRLENRHIVRSRHAHSWALVYLDGVWRDFDTTPSSWVQVEAEDTALFQPLLDFWSFCMFKLSEWRWQESERSITRYIWWLLIPLFLLLAYRLYSRKRLTRVALGQGRAVRSVPRQGTDSDFYLVERRLTELGYPRYSGETLSTWIRRIEETEPFLAGAGALQPLLSLHYRYRFDPEGISSHDREALRSRVLTWLDGAPEP
jgi:hypothetical protein